MIPVGWGIAIAFMLYQAYLESMALAVMLVIGAAIGGIVAIAKTAGNNGEKKLPWL